MIDNSAASSLSDTGELESLNDAPFMPVRASSSSDSSSQKMPWRLRLQISGESHTTIGMEVKDKILIGRSTENSDAQPDLDLTPYGALSRGVSRQHAQIVQQEDSLYVEDLNSTNKTFLNGFELKPYIRFRLCDGDELTLGTLRLVIRFVKSPI